MKTHWTHTVRIRTFALVLAFMLPPFGFVHGAETNESHHAQFESDIRAFESADMTTPPPANAVLFVGSSSIRLWTNAPAQFPGHRIINRGFGGSHLSDSVVFAKRIVIPNKPKVVVLYAGDNDIAAGKSAKTVLADFKSFVALVQGALPETTIVYLSIKPSLARIKLMEQMRAANGLIREFSNSKPRLVFVDVFTPMLGSDGKPRGELFIEDGLHINAEGYKLWTGIVAPVLDKIDPPLTQ